MCTRRQEELGHEAGVVKSHDSDTYEEQEHTKRIDYEEDEDTCALHVLFCDWKKGPGAAVSIYCAPVPVSPNP